jgi:hypothetical protein
MTTRTALPARITYEPHREPPRITIDAAGYRPVRINFGDPAELAASLDQLAAYGHLPRHACYVAWEAAYGAEPREELLDSGRDAAAPTEGGRHGCAGSARPALSCGLFGPVQTWRDMAWHLFSGFALACFVVGLVVIVRSTWEAWL